MWGVKFCCYRYVGDVHNEKVTCREMFVSASRKGIFVKENVASASASALHAVNNRFFF